MDPNNDNTLVDEIRERFYQIFGEDVGTYDAIPDSQTIRLLSSPIKDLKSIVLSIDWEITEQVMSRFGEEVAGLQKIYKDNSILTQFLKMLEALGKYIKKNGADSHPDSVKALYSIFDCFEKIVISEKIPRDQQKALLKAEVNHFNELKGKISVRSKEKREESYGEEQEAVSAAPPEPVEEKIVPDREIVMEEVVPEEAPHEEPSFVAEPAEQVAVPIHEETETIEYSAVEASPPPDVAAVQAEEPSVAEAGDIKGMTPHEAFAFALEEIKEVIRSEFRALRAEIKMWREDR